jgi:hypothetical protein
LSIQAKLAKEANAPGAHPAAADFPPEFSGPGNWAMDWLFMAPLSHSSGKRAKTAGPI